MKISLVRIDERLIHGQVAYSWSVEYPVDRIIVVDDEVAKNEIQKITLELAVPKKTKFSAFDIEQATNYLKTNSKSNERIFIIVKNPTTVLKLIENGIKIESVNVGGMYYSKGKEQIAKTIYVDEEDKLVFKKLLGLGVELEIRTSPKDKKVDLSKLI